MNRQIINAKSRYSGEIKDLQLWLNEVGNKLTIDGIWGAKTQAAVEQYEAKLAKTSVSQWQNLTVSAAKLFVEMEEIPGNMGFKNEAYYKLMNAVGFRKGDAWCCYAAELCWKLGHLLEAGLVEIGDVFNPNFAITGFGGTIFKSIDKLFSASTQTTFSNFAKSPNYVAVPYTYIATDGSMHRPISGALVIYQQSDKPSLGHAGILDAFPDKSDRFFNYEGNTSKAGSREGTTFLKKDRNPFNKTGLVVRGFIQPYYLG